MKTLKMTVLAMVVAVSGMNIYNSQMESKNMDYLTLENVEAIADDNEAIVHFPCISQKGEKCQFTAGTADGLTFPAWIDDFINKP